MMKQAGMTLVELLVAMAIGLGITLAVTSLLIASENHKRITTSTNDAQQTGAYGYYALDKVLRGAGSGIGQSVSPYPSGAGLLGCHLNVKAAGNPIFPRGTAFPLPFAGFLGGAANTLNVAPVLIGAGQSQGGSDIIMVMAGSGSAGGVSRQITGGGGATSATLDNTVGFFDKDLVMVSQNGVPDCLMEEVAGTPATPTLTLGGTYYTVGGVTNMASLAASTLTYVTPIGNAAANNLQFLLYGVDANRTLYSYDLLQNLHWVGGSGGDSAQAIADGVAYLYALYGVDTNTDGIQDGWVSPADANWDINTVMNSAAKMQQIISVHVALVVRGEYYDKNNNLPVSPGTLTIFNGLTRADNSSLAQPIALSVLDQQYRYRVLEFTVPLRNMIVLNGGP
jgi:type IV pilus assembly protein PilW